MPRKNLQLAGALGQASADKRVEILRRVAAVGSISQAARDAGVSYKAAWQALDTLSNLAGAALVVRAVGGAGGGGAHLTPAGEQVLRAAGEVARARDAVLQKLRPGAPALGALGLRTSMRNQLPGRIRRMRLQAGAMEVELELAGAVLRSRITRESAQLLGLARQQEVLALCKATAVEVRAQLPAHWGDNLLAGAITRAPRAQGGEVALALDGGLQLVGFAGAGSGLRVGHAAFARVDPSAVVIALP
ncbi:LysR family transcriptional regulator [Ramlibacter tataouinensis]|uniref:TOBE domain-containing protein n=1 Tax=Ramlibacter tataouinensis TaxID=94132 RepID=UPI0022F3E607|nr:TOBE domain-containing protein [Ramlibacter tataouinensis]WBY01005.1 LysR family transcriptional regulator [Ramlibacter tataouinensis]